MKKEKCSTDIEIASPGPQCNYYGRHLSINRNPTEDKEHMETKMILDLTKPAPPTYLPPRCGLPEEVVEAVNLEALQDYKGLQKVLKEVQRPESTLSRLCWGYSAFTTCQAAFQPFFCSRAPENLFRGDGKVFNGHTDSSFDGFRDVGIAWH